MNNEQLIMNNRHSHSFRVDFPDVTLVCKDVQQIGTHKVILLSSVFLDFSLDMGPTTSGFNNEHLAMNNPIQLTINNEQSVN